MNKFLCLFGTAAKMKFSFLNKEFWGYYLIVAAMIGLIILGLQLDALYKTIKTLLGQ